MHGEHKVKKNRFKVVHQIVTLAAVVIHSYTATFCEEVE
jgi:uncharacterized membrane protein YsdA (DUF1294 family)